MAKLELIYNCCAVETIAEVSDFWKHYKIDADNLSIDTDQLQGIVIFVVSRLNYP